MKATHILIALTLPLSLFGQSKSEAELYPIYTQGESLVAQNLYDSAAVYAQSFLSRPELDLASRSQALLILARSHFSVGEADEALPLNQKSLAIARKIKNENLKLKSLLGVSACMLTKTKPRVDSALLCLEEAMPLATQLQDTMSLARIFFNLSVASMEEKEFEKALSYCNLCEELLKDSRFEYLQGVNFSNKGGCLLGIYWTDEKIEGLKNAQAYLKKAVDIYRKLGKLRDEANALNTSSGAALWLEDYERSKSEVRRSIEIGEQLKDTLILLDAYYNLGTTLETTQERKEAAEALTKVVYFLDKLGTKREAEAMEVLFTQDEKRTSTTLIKNRVKFLTQEIEVEQSQREKTMALIAGLLALTLAVYFYQKKKQLAQKQALLREELGNLLKTKEIDSMRARIAGEEQGRHQIARQIHDGVGGLLVSAKWNLESALEELPKNATNVAHRLTENLRLQEDSYKELRRVVYQLERSDTPWWEDLQKFYEQFSGNNKTKIRFYTYNLGNAVRGHVGEEARLIVQEIVTNALKHANATEINVQINLIDKVLGIIIEDNGIGFDMKNTIKGMGLRSIEERASKLNGSISIETGRGAGTTVFVDIPISPSMTMKENPLLYAGAN